MAKRFLKANIFHKISILSTIAQCLLIVINIFYPMDWANFAMFIINYVFGFSSILSLAFDNIAKHFLAEAFLGCFLLFLMAQKPFMPGYNVFRTFVWTELNTQQYFVFATILFMGIAGTFYSYLFFHKKNDNAAETHIINQGIDLQIAERILTVLLIATFPLALYMQGKIVYVKSSMDYTAGYLVNVDIPAVAKIGYYLYSSIILMYFAIKPKKNRMFAAMISYLIVEGGLQLLQGRRAMFAATLLFSIWYLIKYFQIKKIKPKALVLIGAVAVGAVFLFVIVEQSRDGADKSLSLETIKNFLISTGGSDSVIANTIVRKNDFPKQGIYYLLDPLINNFAGNILRGVSGVPQGMAYIQQHNSFPHWISYLTQSELYLSGHGMGSSFLAEAYLTLGIAGVFFATVFMGWLIAKTNSITLGKGLFGAAVGFFLSKRLFTIPRDGMFSWFGDSIYLIFAFILVASIHFLWSNNKQKHALRKAKRIVRRMEKNECRTVTFGVIAYNEHKYLPELLQDLLVQSYPKDLTEVILVDGISTDDTKQIMESFCAEHQAEYLSIKVLDNPKQIQPAGWNLVIENSTSDVILRIDAHAKLPSDFVEKSMARINSGEFVCGGPRENIIDEDTLWKKMLLDAEQSLFGSGFAAYRRQTEERKYVNSLFHGAYRREVFEKVGEFDERLIRTEDNEIHYRIRQNGFRICYDPVIRSYYQTRNSLGRMLKQKYQNGLWIGRTLFMCPGCISLFHLVPFAFVIALAGCGLLAFLGIGWLLAAMMAAYGLFLLVNTVSCLIKSKNPADLLLPVVYFLMHLVYGVGTAVGIAKGKV